MTIMQKPFFVRLLQITALATICAMGAVAPAYCADTDRAKPRRPSMQLKTPSGVEIDVFFSGTRDIAVNQEQTDTFENALFALASVPAGLVMALLNPLYIFAPVAGVASVPAGQALKQQIETVTEALDPEKFSTAIAGAMLERLQTTSDISAGTRYAIDITSFGLAAGSGGAPKVFETNRDVCLFVSGTLLIALNDGANKEQTFWLTSSNKTEGFPPPICLPFNRFSGDDGRLLRSAMMEMASVIGAWSAQQRLR